MALNRVKEAYFKLPDGSEFYRMFANGDTDVSILSLSESGVIIYDTRINRELVESKFNNLQLAELTQEEFEKKYYEIKEGNKNERVDI